MRQSARSAGAGDMARARAEIAVLNSFAPGFIANVFRGENPVFTRREDMEHLLGGLRLAGAFGVTRCPLRILVAVNIGSDRHSLKTELSDPKPDIRPV